MPSRSTARDLADIRGWVADSGEGRWTVAEAIDLDVPTPIITLSLLARFASRQEESYSAQVLAALRQQFGGHAIKSATSMTDHADAKAAGTRPPEAAASARRCEPTRCAWAPSGARARPLHHRHLRRHR